MKTNRGCCAHILLTRAAILGMEITVSTRRPVVLGRYYTPGLTCPHGVTYWFEPTGEQIAAWTKAGVP